MTAENIPDRRETSCHAADLISWKPDQIFSSKVASGDLLISLNGKKKSHESLLTWPRRVNK